MYLFHKKLLNMETKRLFIGTFINNSLFESKYKSIRNDFEQCCNGKWVEMSNLHFTYQFLGDVDTGNITEIRNSLKDFLINYDSKLIIKGLSALPKLNFPKVLYVKVENEVVINIQKQVESVLISWGFQPENRAYTPHITLLRIKKFERNQFIETIEKYKDFEIGEMNNFSINIIESQLTKYGPIYKKI